MVGRKAHVHDWYARGVHRIEVWADKPDDGQKRFPTNRYTHVLYVCGECGEPRVLNVQGHWTLEQVQRAPRPPDADGAESPWKGYWREGIDTK